MARHAHPCSHLSEMDGICPLLGEGGAGPLSRHLPWPTWQASSSREWSGTGCLPACPSTCPLARSFVCLPACLPLAPLSWVGGWAAPALLCPRRGRDWRLEELPPLHAPKLVRWGMAPLIARTLLLQCQQARETKVGQPPPWSGGAPGNRVSSSAARQQPGIPLPPPFEV